MSDRVYKHQEEFYVNSFITSQKSRAHIAKPKWRTSDDHPGYLMKTPWGSCFGSRTEIYLVYGTLDTY